MSSGPLLRLSPANVAQYAHASAANHFIDAAVSLSYGSTRTLSDASNGSKDFNSRTNPLMSNNAPQRLMDGLCVRLSVGLSTCKSACRLACLWETRSTATLPADNDHNPADGESESLRRANSLRNGKNGTRAKTIGNIKP